MTNIFSRIFAYRQSDSRTPKEDYFTELFASILEKCESFATFLIGKLICCEELATVTLKPKGPICFRDVG